MKTTYLLLVLGCFFLFFGTGRAQYNSVQKLEEVTVSDIRIQRYSDGHRIGELKDSILEMNGVFATSLLNFNSGIYFRENGLGMVASPSFRGTGAAHTAVVWNGININSQLTGQMDFNTINPLNYNSVAVRSGGGSAPFGSGAIGGSIHLNNDLRFEKHLEQRVVTGYGSFDTRSINYGNSLGGNQWSLNFGVNYNSSANDYTYLDTGEQNTNGEFEHVNINVNAGHVIRDKQVIKLYHQSFIGDRNLSGTLVAQGRGRYMDDQHRTQLEWGMFGKKAIHTIKTAHLYEAFKFYEDKDAPFFSEGKVTTFLARYSLDLKLSGALRLNAFAEYNNHRGDGANIGNPMRNDFAITTMLKHKVTDKIGYNLSLRQDYTTDFSSPIVFSGGSSFHIRNWYTLKMNASRNFRAPTFNDLYWAPGGNLDLNAERSHQIDLGHDFKFQPFTVNMNSYYILSEDMIRWSPNNEGIWSPDNLDEVSIHGAELELGYQKPMGRKQQIDIRAHYAYTISKNRATQEQLIYVPFHRGNASLAYRWANFGFFYQQLYNGGVRIIGGSLPGYSVANTGVTYTFGDESKLKCRMGLTLNNVFNVYYENIALRPMPNRNVQTQLTLNF